VRDRIGVCGVAAMLSTLLGFMAVLQTQAQNPRIGWTFLTDGRLPWVFPATALFHRRNSGIDKSRFSRSVADATAGLARFAEFVRGDFDGIAYVDTIFSKANPTTRTCIFITCSHYSMARARTRSLSVVVCEWLGMFRLSTESAGSHGV
jgi:hypothetical protein